MSKNNLNDFFSKQKKTKPKQQAETATKQQAQNQVSDAIPEQVQKPNQDPKQQKHVDDYMSSDEEKTDLQVESNINVMDKATLDAQKRKQQQEEEQEAGVAGWRALDKQGVNNSQAKPEQKAQPSLSGAATAGKKNDGTINFGKGPPKFGKQTNNRGRIMDEDDVEIGASETSKSKAQKNQPSEQLSKKDNANIEMFGRAGPREPRPEVEEKKAPATKPMFTRSKPKVGGEVVESTQESKQNYDFSVFQKQNFSQKKPADGVASEESKQQKPRQFGQQGNPNSDWGNSSKAQAFNDDDWETVKQPNRQRKD